MIITRPKKTYKVDINFRILYDSRKYRLKKKGFEEMFDKLIKMSIKKEPVTSLSNCLENSSENAILEISNLYGKSQSENNNKGQTLDSLNEIIINSVPEYFLYAHQSVIGVFNQLSENTFIISKDTNVLRILSLYRLGYLYLFYDEKSQEITAIIPEEIKNIYKSSMEDSVYLEKLEKNKEIYDYVQALLNLYGVYKIEEFLMVWNEHHAEEITFEEVEIFLNKADEEQLFFWIDNGYIVESGFGNKEEYQGLLNESAGKPYYLPTVKEIEIYKDELVDIDSSYYQKLKSFLSEKASDDVDLDNLLFSLEIICVDDGNIQQVLDIVNESGILFDGMKDGSEFMKLYSEWHNNTRLWINKGFKPVELSSVDIIDNEISKQKKVGRNETCPCGSGKKYKQCCGK